MGVILPTYLLEVLAFPPFLGTGPAPGVHKYYIASENDRLTVMATENEDRECHHSLKSYIKYCIEDQIIPRQMV